MDDTIAQRVADILLSIKGVSFRFDPPFTFTSGIKSPIYLDNRLIMSYPDEREEVIGYYIDVIKNKIGNDTVDAISATATAAIPQGAWISEKLKLPMVYCRSSKKEHGKENQIEGVVTKGQHVVIIEDHISTAGSSVENALAVRALGGIVEYVITTSTYETAKSKETFEKNQLTLLYLTIGKTIVKRALDTGVITPIQEQAVQDWFADPVGWGDRFLSKQN